MAATEFLCTVQGFRMLTPTVFELTFEAESKAQSAIPYEFKAGQFISIVIPGAGPKGRDLRRAYSIASAPHVRPVELCVKLVEGGPGTNYLYTLRPGDTFRGFAPYGDFTYKPKPGKHYCFISTGTGVAPFRSMALSHEYRASPPVSAHCLLGVRTEDELLYREEMNSIPGLKWIETVSQPKGDWKGIKGRVTDFFRSMGEDDFHWRETEYYLCGNGDMIAEVKEILAAKGIQKEAIHQEKYY